MGFAHAAHILQLANLYIIRVALESHLPFLKDCTHVAMLNDVEHSSVRANLDTGHVAVYVHLDDFLFLAQSQALADESATVAEDALVAVGFAIKRKRLEPGEKYIGLELLCDKARWIPSTLRLGHLDRALQIASEMAAPPVELVACLVAIYTWLGLLRRESLSTMQAVFSWITIARTRYTVIWESARKELRLMRDTLSLIYADLTRTPCGIVFAQDAAVDGPRHDPQNRVSVRKRRGAYCLAVARPPYDEIRAVISDFATVGRGNAVPLSLGGRFNPLTYAPQTMLHGRTKIPTGWVNGSVQWMRVLARRFLHGLDISEGEARAALAWVRIFLRVSSMRDLEVLLLGDNAAVSGLVARGRTSKFNLNRIMRMIWCCAALSNNKYRIPWIDTSHQPADGGTRETDGQLLLGPVRFARRTIVMCVWIGNSQLITTIKSSGYHYSLWGSGDRRDRDVLSISGRRKILREIESGTIELIIWGPGSYVRSEFFKPETGLGDIMADGMIVADTIGVPSVFVGRAELGCWSHERYQQVHSDLRAGRINTHTCMHGHHQRHTIVIDTIRCRLDQLSAQCQHHIPNCSLTNRPHVGMDQSSLPNYLGSTDGGVPARLQRKIIELALRTADRGRGVARDSDGLGPHSIGGPTAIHAQGLSASAKGL